MAQQAICADGGIVSQPYAHFEQNESVYRYIEARLDGTRGAYLGANPFTRLRLLFDSATYALLTAQTPLPRADEAFQRYTDLTPNPTREELEDEFADAGIGFHNSKARYIAENWDLIEEVFIPADRALCAGDDLQAQDHLMGAYGVGPAKSAFSLATLGFTDNACADSHICRYFGIDPRSYDKHDARQYRDLVDDAFASVPDLVDETSTFVAQWVTWDLARGDDGSHAPREAQGRIETHDTWFEHVARSVS